MRKLAISLTAVVFLLASSSLSVAGQKTKPKSKLSPDIIVNIRDMSHQEKGFPTYWIVLHQSGVQRNRKSYTMTNCQSSDSNIALNFSPALGIYSGNDGTDEYHYEYSDKNFSIHFYLGEDDGKQLSPPEEAQIFGIAMDDLTRPRNIGELSISALKKWYLVSISTKNIHRPANTVDMVCKTQLRTLNR